MPPRRPFKVRAGALLIFVALLFSGTLRAETPSTDKEKEKEPERLVPTIKESGRFVAQHLTFEAAAVGTWRTSWAEENNPGFHLAGGGGEINIGLELDSGLAVLIGGRALFYSHLGQSDQLNGTYIEAAGQAIIQLRISDWVRIGLGATTGELFRCCGDGVQTAATSVLLYGGFLRVGVDFLPRQSLPRALSLWMRLGIEGQRPDAEMTLMPSVSMNMAVGLGIRL